ncbi:peptidoglycan-binding protein [Rhodoferax lacus]|uniref:Peptidoglycan-binding protein n=1 Tax=Rhodoferax lacus TaxID=2184758 RepID=A0A3E1RA24_9BURK|nr:ExeA family protein [Rhodoferax lacus]RFO96187.1 peptidoglycan-binding protein [Rhodoferax lacus]
MYAQHFKLTQDPFSIAPDPRFLFMSERHREALAHLLFGVTGSGGFVLFTGDIGTGKTTVCRCFLEQMPPACNVAMVFNPKLSVQELLQTICEEFHVDPGGYGPDQTPGLKTYVDALNDFLLQSHAAGQSNLLIIDEAQNLLPEVLEQLRLLTNLETDERKLLQIVLIGQPELRTMLERPDLEQLAQRVIARYHLESLNPEETQRYIQHRFTVAGHSGPLPFDSQALRRIYALSRGVPRRINLLCGRSLLGAWATGLHRVDRAIVDKAAREVFGDAPSTWHRDARTYAALALCVVGVLALGLAVVLQLGHRSVTRAQLASVLPAMAASVPTAPLAVSAGVAGSLPASAVARPLASLESLMPRLPSAITPAWRELGQHWALALDAGDPCLPALRHRMQCYRSTDMTVPLLRQLDRPGILGLQLADGATVYAVLTRLDDQTATLRLAGVLYPVPLIALVRLWRGDFGTFWQPPAGFVPELQDAVESPTWGQLSDQLALLEGKPVRPGAGAALRLDAALMARVKAFQRAQGIKPDGRPGPMTFMQMERALKQNQPSLQAGAP